jgi:plasmid stabilization system protein ParE
MPRIALSAAAWDDLEKLEEFLFLQNDPLTYGLVDYVMQALHVLSHQPGIGRPVGNGTRELIISRHRSGYIAKYEFDETADLVRVTRIRHQRQSGYTSAEI